MIIYHYTNIESLAMILSTRQLKFNRLDCVDDIEEGNINSDGMRIGQYVFISCWTENSEESIPLWTMYANGGTGVRISLDSEMFQDFQVSNLELPNGLRSQGAITVKIPKSEFVRPDYFILPIFNYDSEMFYRRIEYVDDVRDATKEIVERKMTDEVHADVNIDFAKVGKYKHKRWAFQEETRFAITILPTNPLLDSNQTNVSSIAIGALYNNVQLPFVSYYMHLKPEVFEKMAVTLSPMASDAQRILVEALCEKYAPGSVVKESALKQRVRLK